MNQINKNKKILNIFLLYTILLILAHLVIKTYVNNHTTNTILIENAHEKIKNSEKSLNNFIYSSSQTLLYIQSLEEFQNFLDKKIDKKKLEKLFLSYVKNNPSFMQLRFLNHKGMEEIRVNKDRDNSTSYIVKKENLQDKSQRYYFLDSKTKTLGKVWFSKFDKNIENGKVEKPKNLTFRIILPIEHKKEFSGVLIINYLANDFLQQLYSSKLYDLNIYDSMGNHLLDTKQNLAKHFPKDYKNILTNDLFRTNNLISKRLKLSDGNYFLIVLKLKQTYIEKQKQNSNKEYILLFSSVFILSVLLGLGIYKILTNTLTNLKNVEELNKELEESKQRWKFAVEGNKDGLWDWNLKTDEVYFSTQWKKMLGFDEEEIKASLKEWEKRVHPEDIENVYDDIRKYLRGDTEQYQNEHRLLCKDGTYKWILARGIIVQKDKDGTALRMIGTQKDIDEKKKLLLELNKTLDALKEAQKIAKLGIWELDIKTNTLIWSDEVYNIFEIDKEKVDVNYETFSMMIHPEDRQKVKDAYENSLKTKNKYEITHRIKLNNGTIKFVQEQCDTKFDNNGNPIKSIGTIYDITHVHDLTSEIEQERYKYQKLMESSSDAILVTDMQGNLIDYSKEAKKLLGYTNSEMHKLNIQDWEAKQSKKEISQIIQSLSKKPITFETIHKKKDGSTYTASILASKLSLHQKDYIYASVRDVTEQKNLENRLIEQKEEFESIFKYSKDGIAITDLETNFLEFNDAYLTITGFTREELLTKSCIGLTVLEHKEEAQKLINETIEKGFMENIEKECIVSNGKRIYTNMSASLLPDKKRLLIVLKDVTSIKQIEDQSRLIAMGEMIGNIAHQWRQPLSVISTSATGLKFKLEYEQTIDKEFVDYTTEKIVEQTNYLSKTIDDFRNFIKDDKEYREISVKDVIECSLNIVEAVLKNNYITLIENIDDDLTILGNKNELQQAMINIINNAKDTLKEKVENDEDRYIFITTTTIDNDTLELKITDSAGGIAKENINRIFEPYFTTKHQSVGTGLGLAMVDKIIRERHGFKILAFNEHFEYNKKEYNGACFKIIFTKNLP